MKKFISYILAVLIILESFIGAIPIVVAEEESGLEAEIAPEITGDTTESEGVEIDNGEKDESSESDEEKNDINKEEQEIKSSSLGIAEDSDNGAAYMPDTSPPDPSEFLKGLQGKYKTGLFTGTATFNYPIWIPSGRKEMQPKIELSYSSTQTKFNPIIGYGWSLPTNAIYRSSTKGLDKLYAKNEFTLDIFGETTKLILIDKEKRKYAAQAEGKFIDAFFQNNSWVVRDKLGTKYIFGTFEKTRHTNPEDNSKVYKWMLEKVEDLNGNFMKLSYFHDAGRIYPKSIRYTGHGSDNGIYEVQFKRIQNKNNIVSYSTAFKVETRYVISDIEIYSYHSGKKQLIRNYNLKYDENSFASNLLSSITVQGGGKSLPPIQFSYYSGKENVLGKKIGFLKKILYPTGGIQTLTYKPSTAYKRGNGSLENAHLPFIVHTVYTSSIKASKNEPEYTTKYKYSGGHYYYNNLDAYKKEYAGFHLAEVEDSAKNVIKNYFHQSEFAFDNNESARHGEYKDHISKKGRKYREEIYDDKNRLFQVSINQWDTKKLQDEDTENDRYFPFLRRTTKAIYDGNKDYKAVASSFVYDEHGNIIHATDYGEVLLTNDAGDFNDIKNDRQVKTVEYAKNFEKHILKAPKKSTRRNFKNLIIGEEKKYYDNLPFGEIVKGNPTKSKTLVSFPSKYITSTSSYNLHGLIIKSVNARGYETNIKYDKFNIYPKEIINPKGHKAYYIYNYAFGVFMESLGPNGLKTKMFYDELGRLSEIKATNPKNTVLEISQKKYKYKLDKSPISITEKTYLGPKTFIATRTIFDGLGRPIQIRKEAEEKNKFIVTHTSYDKRGNIKREYLPIISTGVDFRPIKPGDPHNEFHYDAVNRVALIQNIFGTTKMSYDNWNKVVIDANGNKKEFIYDTKENFVEVKEYLDGRKYSTFYEYDDNNNLVKITDAKKNIKTFTYDLLGNLIQEEDFRTPDDTTYGVHKFIYDENGNIIESKDAKGAVIKFSYDELDRILTEDFRRTREKEVTYVYDSGQYGIGRLSEIVFNGGVKRYQYDILGRVINEEKSIEGEKFITTFAYDLLDNIKSITYPDDYKVSYTYNNAGLIETVENGNRKFVTNIDYSPIGKISSISYANGVESKDIYDPKLLYRLTHKSTNKGSKKLQDISYAFDPVGNITKVIDTSDTNSAKTTIFTYDDLYRLTSVSVTNAAKGENYNRQYSYDIIGNILSRTDVGQYEYAGGDNILSKQIFSSPHAVTKAGDTKYTYDKNGNLISDSLWQHSWDYKDRLLSSASKDISIHYKYDEGGNRIKKMNTASNTKTIYVNRYYDVEDNTIKRHIFAGNIKIASLIDSKEEQGGEEGGSGSGQTVILNEKQLEVSIPKIKITTNKNNQTETSSGTEIPNTSSVEENDTGTSSGTVIPDTSNIEKTDTNTSSGTEIPNTPDAAEEILTQSGSEILENTGSGSEINASLRNTHLIASMSNSILAYEEGDSELIFDSARDFQMTKQGVNNTYFFREKDGKRRSLSRRVKYSRWIVRRPYKKHEYLRIDKNSIHPGGRKYGAAIYGWKSNFEGKVLIESKISDENPRCGDGIRYKILKNKEILFDQAYDNKFTEQKIAVETGIKEGDMIYSHISKRKTNWCDGTHHHFTVTKVVVPEDPPEDDENNNDGSEEDDSGDDSLGTPNVDEEGKKTIFHHTDHLLGSNVDTDINGNLLQLLDYYPFGQVRIDEKSGNYENDYKFTGKELDKDTDLYYYGARYYDAKIGRFISVDPWEGDLIDPQTLNKYSYVRNNPLIYIDPTGEKVSLIARKVDYRLIGKLAIHVFIQIEPDEPHFFGNQTKITLGGYTDKSGMLIKAMNAPSDYNMTEDFYRGSMEIEPGPGKNDTEFIQNILEAYDSYDESWGYDKMGLDTENKRGNCNNLATTFLVKAGTDQKDIQNFNPFGISPGLGKVLPNFSDYSGNRTASAKSYSYNGIFSVSNKKVKKEKSWFSKLFQK